jgi:hypothetical protein
VAVPCNATLLPEAKASNSTIWMGSPDVDSNLSLLTEQEDSLGDWTGAWVVSSESQAYEKSYSKAAFSQVSPVNIDKIMLPWLSSKLSRALDILQKQRGVS